MIGVPLLFLAYLSIAIANSDDYTMVPTCERQSPTDIHFDFTRLGLTALRKGFVSGDSVTCINLTGNAISELQIGAFDGLPGLLYLNLARNPISFEDFMKMNLPALRALVLDGPFRQNGIIENKHNPASEYYSDIYDPYKYHYEHGYARLETRLNNISPIFLPRLEKLSFRNYETRAVRRWLSHINAPNLTHLLLDSNRFEAMFLWEVNENLVHKLALSLPKLRYMSINRNGIRNLCIHDCDGNSVAVGEIPALEHLSLANNQLSNIKPNTFENNIHLKFLNLSGNAITSLSRDLFRNVPLRILTLGQNKLTDVPDISGLQDLELLDLSGNLIGSIDKASFFNLTRLRSVDLHQNRLISVPDGTFAHLPALVELDLSGNELTTLAPNWIGPGGRLASLKLDRNSFYGLANMSLGALVQLDNLSIGDNPLGVVKVGTLKSLPPDTQINICSA